ncbi:MAG TPA: hypothetical protein VMJ10_14825 [Kofleriaceae bacterium]|nr:hypothetical protein [Kofleriaceae bacterium]
MRHVILVLALALVGCVHAAAIATESAAIASLACDGGSTHTALESSRYIETNPVMGERPDPSVQAAYFGGAGAAVVGINELLAHGLDPTAGDVWRIIANVAIIGVEVDAVYGNSSIGVPVCGI